MTFSSKAEYGVRLMVELGRQDGQGPTSLKAIADAEALPLSYLEHVVASLKKANLVESSRSLLSVLLRRRVEASRARRLLRAGSAEGVLQPFDVPSERCRRSHLRRRPILRLRRRIGSSRPGGLAGRIGGFRPSCLDHRHLLNARAFWSIGPTAVSATVVISWLTGPRC